MKIAVLSCANTGNFGDDIIFEGLREKLWTENRVAPTEISQFIRITDETATLINQHDLLIVGGGELLANSDILDQIVSHDIRVPYLFLAIGIGSENDVKHHLNAVKPVMWMPRSQVGVDILRGLGVKNVMLHRDLLYSCPNPSILIGGNGGIAVSLKNVNKPIEYIDEIAKVLDEARDEGIFVDLLALNSRARNTVQYYGETVAVSDCDDKDLCEMIRQRMRHEIEIVAYQGNAPYDFLSAISRYRGVVGERLHSVIAAHHCGVPFKAIAYHPKCNKFLSLHNVEDRMIGASPDDIKRAIRELWKGL